MDKNIELEARNTLRMTCIFLHSKIRHKYNNFTYNFPLDLYESGEFSAA